MKRRLFGTLQAVSRTLKQELVVYQLVLRDCRTPKLAKMMLGLAIGYLLLPFDLIPDFLPIIGHLDDLILVPTLVIVALRLIPDEVIAECRSKAAPLGSTVSNSSPVP